MASKQSRRPKFQQRTFRLVSRKVIDGVIALLNNLPIDTDLPIQVVVREEPRTRHNDQNAAYWAGPLRDIAEQAWFDGRQFSAEVLHEFFKREFLPEDDTPVEEGLFKDGYRKWDFDPMGERVLIGSTTMLTVRGFSIFMEQVHAFGASAGVLFHVPGEVQ